MRRLYSEARHWERRRRNGTVAKSSFTLHFVTGGCVSGPDCSSCKVAGDGMCPGAFVDIGLEPPCLPGSSSAESYSVPSWLGSSFWGHGKMQRDLEFALEQHKT